MTRAFRSWLRSLDVAERRKQREWDVAWAQELYVPERELPEGLSEYQRLMVTLDWLSNRLSVEVLIESLKSDRAFRLAGQRGQP